MIAKRRLMPLAAAAIAAATLLIASPASAAPLPIAPPYASASSTAVPTVPGVTGTDGIEILSINGVAVDPTASTYSMRTDIPNIITAQFRQPPTASGVIVDPAAVGIFTITTVENSPVQTGGSSPAYSSAAGPVPYPSQQLTIPMPVGTQYSDMWMNATRAGIWTSTFDFSGLTGGALPVGSVLGSYDVDQCGGAGRMQAEHMTFLSSSSSAWLDYYSSTGSLGGGGMPVVTVDGGQYDIAPNPGCAGSPDRVETFLTNEAVSSLTIVSSTNGQTTGGGDVGWSLLSPVVTAASSISIVKSADRSAVTQVGDLVSYSFLVTNTGNVPLSAITVADTPDAPAGGVTVMCPLNTLAAGASETCTGEYSVTAADIVNGVITDIAAVSSTDPEDASVTGTSNEVSITVSIDAPMPSDPAVAIHHLPVVSG
jgi:uncharacterized repeat protein (TIGR01451 family)